MINGIYHSLTERKQQHKKSFAVFSMLSKSKTISITNRKEAIKTACQLAQESDIILIAGKGHETYQEIKGERFDFDDFKVVSEFLTIIKK